MNDGVAVSVEHVSKKFCRSLRRSMTYGLKDVARNLVGLSSHPERLRRDEFWAVDDVSFEVKQGETLGIIGANGSGKTTMLSMLNGIIWPDKGKIRIKGRTGALISVGAGFHPMLSGRENIHVQGGILGLTKREIERKFDDIVEFADIGDFLDAPVKFYSSGMVVRLGFAIAINIEPEVLLIDEVLAVGDIGFQSRCYNRLAKLRERGVATIMVSHNMHAISGFSQRVLYLNSSKTRFCGDVGEAIDLYKRDVFDREEPAGLEFAAEDALGSGLVRVTKVQFLDESERDVAEINAGSMLVLRVHYQSEGYTGKVELDIGIRDEKGDMFFLASNESYGQELVTLKKSGYLDVIFKNMCANNQRILYFIALWKDGRAELFDWKRELPLYVKGNPLSHGYVLLDVDWEAN